MQRVPTKVTIIVIGVPSTGIITYCGNFIIQIDDTMRFAIIQKSALSRGAKIVRQVVDI